MPHSEPLYIALSRLPGMVRAYVFHKMCLKHDAVIKCDGYQINKVCIVNHFQALLEENPAKHPIIILKDVPFQHLTAILEFMYAGEVNVAQDQLPVSVECEFKLQMRPWN